MTYTSFDGYPDNQWWVAAASFKVEKKPLARILLEQSVLIYRPTPDSVAILEDRCPHRQVPLSLGKQIGSEIQCTYHGLRFGGDGTCTFAPGTNRPLPAANIISYPCVERHGYIWVWFGSKQPREELIPDYSYQTSPEFSGKVGYSNIGCSYLLGIENVLDTSHFGFLHTNSVGSAGYEKGKKEVTVVDGEVHSIRRVDDLKPSGLFDSFTEAETISQVDVMRWQGPSYMFLKNEVTAPERTFHMRGLAPYTPEHRNTHHHWFAHFVDFPMPPEAAAKIREMALLAIEEDKAVLEANQHRIDSGEALDPVMLPEDKAPVLMRRLNSEMLQREGVYQPVRPPVPTPRRVAA